MSNTIIVQKNSVKSETDKPSSYSPHLFLHSTHIYSVYNAVVFQLLSRLWPFAALWTVAHQPSLSFTISQSRLKLMSIELVMPSNHLIHCYCLLSLLSVFPTIRVFSSESALCIRWPKDWSFSYSISLSNEYSGVISFRMNWFNHLAVQGTFKGLLQNHSSKASILQRSACFMVQLSHSYVTTEKTIRYWGWGKRVNGRS